MMTTPSHELSIRPHPRRKALVQRLKKEGLPVDQLPAFPFWYMRKRTAQWPDINLLGSNMGDELRAVFGAPHGTIPGKYRRAEVFIFEFAGQIVMATCEKGDRGSSWWWLSDEHAPNRSYANMVQEDNEAMLGFWPAFVDQLCRLRGMPLDLEQSLSLFPPDSPPVVERQRRELEDRVPPTSTPSRAGPRL